MGKNDASDCKIQFSDHNDRIKNINKELIKYCVAVVGRHCQSKGGNHLLLKKLYT